MAYKSTTAASKQRWHHRRLNVKRIFSSSLGSMLGIGAVAYLSAITGQGFLIPPLGASCFIAFVIPESAFAQPRNIIGGHLLSSMIGLLFSYTLGMQWWSFALAVSIAIAAMQILRILHPPAAADPILLMMQGAISWDILLTSVLGGSITLAVIATLFNKLIIQHRYYRIVLLFIAKLYSDNAKRLGFSYKLE